MNIEEENQGSAPPLIRSNPRCVSRTIHLNHGKTRSSFSIADDQEVIWLE